MTRAKRHLALVGDSETISKEPFIKGLIDYCHNHGNVLSANEYLHGEELALQCSPVWSLGFDLMHKIDIHVIPFAREGGSVEMKGVWGRGCGKGRRSHCPCAVPLLLSGGAYM